jgi:hypothetical protein
MHIQLTTSVVTSLGIARRGVTVDLPAAEATALIHMGRAVPVAADPVVPEHRDDLPVVRRGRAKKAAVEVSDGAD